MTSIPSKAFSLRDEKAVERVGVAPGQFADALRVNGLDGKILEAIGADRSGG